MVYWGRVRSLKNYSSSFVESIQKRLLVHNQNWLCVVCGGTGTGKSYSALRLASMVDPTFNIDRVVFRVEDFMKLLNAGNLVKGNAIMFDEAGVNMNSREWYSVQNKCISYLLQTFRHRNLAVIFTTPNLSYIDKAVRGLFHCYIETQRIDRRENKVVARIYRLKVLRDGKILFPYPKEKRSGTDRTVAKNIFRINKPDPMLTANYEKKADEFKEYLGRDLELTLQNSKNSGGRPKKITEAETNYIVWLRQRGESQDHIVKKVFDKYGLKVSQGTVSNILKTKKA